jgi:hypothetical protein
VAGDDGEPDVLQAADDLGRRRLGEPGELPELTAGQPPALEQVGERGAHVHRSEQAGRAGHRHTFNG